MKISLIFIGVISFWSASCASKQHEAGKPSNLWIEIAAEAAAVDATKSIANIHLVEQVIDDETIQGGSLLLRLVNIQERNVQFISAIDDLIFHASPRFLKDLQEVRSCYEDLKEKSGLKPDLSKFSKGLVLCVDEKFIP